MAVDSKHLEFIQNAVTRFANNSFLLKGWTITLVGVFMAFTSKDSSHKIILLGFFPTILFWWLDAYYLWHERMFRDLYKDVAAGNNRTKFTMDIVAYKSWRGYAKALFSVRLILFYWIVLVVTLVAALLVKGHHGA